MALQNAIISNMLTRAKRLILYTPSIYKFCPIYAIADQSKAWKDKNPHAILLLGPGCVCGASCRACLAAMVVCAHGRARCMDEAGRHAQAHRAGGERCIACGRAVCCTQCKGDQQRTCVLRHGPGVWKRRSRHARGAQWWANKVRRVGG
jgi:hypothetical protein